jgi:hypothetical protein
VKRKSPSKARAHPSGSDGAAKFLTPAGIFPTGVFFPGNEIYLLRAASKYIGETVADVAELADALDSKFDFCPFFRVATHHFKLP